MSKEVEIYRTSVAGYDIILKRKGRAFIVVYGAEVTVDCTLDEAMQIIAGSIEHGLHCEGKLD